MHKRIALLVLALALLFALGGCGAKEEADDPDNYAIESWADPVLEAVVRDRIGQPTGLIETKDIRLIQILEIRAGSIEINNGNSFSLAEGEAVHSLDDLVHFQRLGGLWVVGTELEDFSIIARLTNLQELRLYSNPNLTDLAPLADLPKLVTLVLHNNAVTDFSPILGIETLVELDLHNNGLRTIDLSRLTRLRKLRLDNNRIEELDFLAGLTGLRELDLAANYVRDITPLLNMTGLETLRLDYNGIVDLPDLSAWTSLSTLELRDNFIEDISPLAALEKLQVLNITDNRVESLAPVGELSELRYLYAADNRYTTLAPLQNLSKLTRLDVSGNTLADYTPLSGLKNLTTLDLTGCGISSIELDSLEKSLRGCTIAT